MRHILCDGHGSHKWIVNWLLGLETPLSEELRQQVGFFKDLKFLDLPVCCLPIGIRIAYYGNESVHVFNGIAHCQKNVASQLRSPLRTVHFGELWSDHSACLEMGLFPASFIGSDEMSDKQAALMFLDEHQASGSYDVL